MHVNVEQLEGDLGAALRTLRVAKRLTRAQLAERANVSVGALRNLETGSGSTITTLVRAVHALGADDWLTQLAPPPAPFSPLAVADEARRVTPSTRRQRVRRATVG